GRGGGGQRNGNLSRRVVLNQKDVTALSNKANVPDVVAVTPIASSSATASYNGSTYTPSSFVGVDPVYAQIKNWPVTEGRFLNQSDIDSHAKVVVLGTTA